MKSFRKVTLLMICLIFSALMTVHAAAAPAQVQDVKVENYSKSQHKISWSPVSGASGYQVYCKDYSESTTTFKRVKTITKASRKYTLINDRCVGKAYAYIVRAYTVENGTKVFGDYSSYAYGYISPGESLPDAKQETATAEPSAAVEETQDEQKTETPVDSSIIVNPSTKQKYKKVFGDASLTMRYPGGYYTSAAQAAANMQSITVKTWDFKSGNSGEKITRTWTIQVHKSLASTVKQIFQEIYNGAEKFPIHELGGYAWRGGHSEHNTGTAIDINWTENYMVNVATGAISCGKYWKPGVDPYSIAKDGEVAKIFEKYGFAQGDWGNSKDYMHFSYFWT